ncbi:cytochrome P450 monooxygenase [Flagelloscypha sp. PMI_526]|nr:cytochrome P450 monooxygenase [Flagelloscypha sp. PMI_526]
MDVPDIVTSPYFLLPLPFILAALGHIVPYYVDHWKIRKYPGPWLAKYSDLWLGKVAQTGHRSETVHQAHLEYGPVIRIAPRHVSIAIPEALGTVYGHGNGALKADFYDAFVSIRRGLFNSRDRAEHTRKRKIVSHIFSQKSVLEFEPQIQLYVAQLLSRWDAFIDAGQGAQGGDGEGWHNANGRVWLDLLPWVSYLAFDIIGDLAFGSPFGMIAAGQDAAPVPAPSAAAAVSQAMATGEGWDKIEYTTIPAVRILNGRGEFSASLGVLPPWVRPYVRKYIPWFRRGGQDVKNLAGIAIMAVAKRLAWQAKALKENGVVDERNDLLSKLQKGRDDQGQLMGTEELTAEALTMLIAGSDTTSNSTCAIIYHLALYPETQKKLQAELDALLGPPGLEHTAIDPNTFKSTPYLEAVINEGLRIHSTSSMGLPRIVPPGGLTIDINGKEEHFVEGTHLSVPSYTIHRDMAVWGNDVTVFRPERWLDDNKEAKERRERTFNPYSIGPRGCVGKNLASLELLIIISSIMHRFHFVLEDPSFVMETREGFLRKPVGCRVGIKRRV